MVKNKAGKNLLIVIVLALLWSSQTPSVIAATPWQSLLDEAGFDLGITSNQLINLPTEKQQELETKLRLIAAGKSWVEGNFEKGVGAFSKIVEINPSSPSIKGVDILKWSLVGVGIKIVADAPKMTLTHLYVTNRDQDLADDVAWQKAIEPSLSSCKEWGVAQLNETFAICPILQDEEKLEALHQSAQFIWSGITLYRQYQNPEQQELLKQEITQALTEAGETKEENGGFWSRLFNAIKAFFQTIKNFFTGLTSSSKDVSSKQAAEETTLTNQDLEPTQSQTSSTPPQAALTVPEATATNDKPAIEYLSYSNNRNRS